MKESIYMNETQKVQLVELAKKRNLSLSKYLVERGLGLPINSDRMKSELASIACKIYELSYYVENAAIREEFKMLGGEIYGILKNQA